jgi:hypothetical protein
VRVLRFDFAQPMEIIKATMIGGETAPSAD